MSSKRSMPSVPTKGGDRRNFDAATKDILDQFTGATGKRIKKLDPATATVSDCALKINEILDLLQ